MSRDIRSYFMPAGGNKKKQDNNTGQKNDLFKSQRKRQIVVLDSDSDDESIVVQTKKQKGNSLSAKDHNKDEIQKADKTSSKTKLKPIDAAAVFGDKPIKRTVPKPPPVTEKPKTEEHVQFEDLHSDSEFEAILLQLDERENSHRKEKKKTPEKEQKKTPSKDKQPEKEQKKTPSKNKQPEKEQKKTPNKEKQKQSQNDADDYVTKKKPKLEVDGGEKIKLKDKHKHEHKNSASSNSHIETSEVSPFFKASEKLKKFEKGSEKNTNESNHRTTFSDLSCGDKNVDITVKKEIKSDEDSKLNLSIERKISTDDSFSDDAFEKKRQHAIQYQKYLHREGPKHLGEKEIPEGKPGCLSGLVFVITGVLDTIDREQASSLIQQYGGRVTTSVSRNTSYIILGEEPGPSKVDKATKFGTKQLTEDGFLELIKTRPGSSIRSGDTPKSKKKDVRNGERETVNTSKQIDKNIHNGLKEESIREVEQLVQTSSSLPSPSDGNAPANTFKSVEEVVRISSLWVDKYKPTSVKQIIGQQGDRSNVKKLSKWLQNWHSNHSGKNKLARPSPWAKDDSGAFFKAALLSGPPGVGKTTTAHLICKELGFDAVEFNASDTRSKKLLHEEVSELLSTKSLSGYFQGSSGAKPTEKHVLIMDEVDGMAGNEDRGGVQELIQLIKNSRIPIICMCNDRHHKKIRSLTNYCFDLQFSRPRLEQIRGAMMSVCFKEGIKIPPDALNDVITSSNNDIRQVLHHLSMWSVKDKELSVEKTKEEAQKAKKDLKLGPWDVLRKVFSADSHKTMSIYDKSDLFFHDYSLGPLFVQENYLGVLPHKARNNKTKHLEIVAKTAESLSMGDLVEKSIRSKNAWSLLPMQAMYSSVIPGDLMEGHLTKQITFPAWLGKNSRRNKFNRLVQELHMHMRLSISGSREAVNLDYLTHIRDAITRPLIKDGTDGIPATLGVMQNYYLMREDIDSVMELSLWPNQKDPMSLIDSKVKAALTRTYNKEGITTPYSIVNIKKGTDKSSQDMDLDMEIDGEEVADEDVQEDDITKDAMIKAKKRPASAKDSSESSGVKKRRGGSKGGSKKESKGKGKT